MIVSYFKKVFLSFTFKDELCGEWHSEDGSGFMIVMGSWMKINSNGTGKYESWCNSGDEGGYHYKGKFKWVRIEKKTITIQEYNSDKIEIILYELNNFHGKTELKSHQPELSKFGIDAFWNFAQTMFKIN